MEQEFSGLLPISAALAGTIQLEGLISWVWSGSGTEGADCIAVGWGGELGENLQPPRLVVLASNGESQVGFAPRAAPNRGTSEQEPAQCQELAKLQLSEPSLEQHTQIVRRDGQMVNTVAQKLSQARRLIPNSSPSSLIRFSMSARPLS